MTTAITGISSITMLETIDVELDNEKNEYNRKMLDDNFIYIPEQYYRQLVKSGWIEQLVQTIHKVNLEEKTKLKKLSDKEMKDTNKEQQKQDVSTQTMATDFEPEMILDDYFNYNEDLQPGATYTIQSFYDTIHTTTQMSMFDRL